MKAGGWHLTPFSTFWGSTRSFRSQVQDAGREEKSLEGKKKSDGVWEWTETRVENLIGCSLPKKRLLLQASKSVQMLGEEDAPCLHPLKAEGFSSCGRSNPEGLDTENGHEPAARGKAGTHSTTTDK